jgi:2-polyprenyl-3-methyl-5-hydroxy-6-metoxy-1,4-benzoquinol methylase
MNIIKKLFSPKSIRWEQAQLAEKHCWSDLWKGEGSADAEYQIKHEKIKNHFLIEKWEEAIDVRINNLTANKSVLDVGCGPTSYVAENLIQSDNEGIDPLDYPSWVYQRYEKLKFKVHKVQFESFKCKKKYEIIVFYNALQHFFDLEKTASTAYRLCQKNGRVIIREYLEIPSDEAHIHVLRKLELDKYFSSAGFNVKSYSKAVRLPGYVEKGAGEPVDIYIALLTK